MVFKILLLLLLLLLLVLFQCLSLCSVFIKFNQKTDILNSIFYKNSYRGDLVDRCIKEFLDKILALKPVGRRVPKKDLVLALSYLGKFSPYFR